MTRFEIWKFDHSKWQWVSAQRFITAEERDVAEGMLYDGTDLDDEDLWLALGPTQDDLIDRLPRA